MLAVGRLSDRIVRFVLFLGAAVGGALLTFLAVTLAERIAGLSRADVRIVVLVGCGLAVMWFVRKGRMRISIRCRQVHRHTTRGRYSGPSAFGFLLGLGWWTWVSSPLFWLGLVLSTLEGQAIVAAVVYGIGRSATALYGVCLPHRARNGLDPVILGHRIDRVLFLLTPWVSVAAAGFALTDTIR